MSFGAVLVGVAAAGVISGVAGMVGASEADEAAHEAARASTKAVDDYGTARAQVAQYIDKGLFDQLVAKLDGLKAVQPMYAAQYDQQIASLRQIAKNYGYDVNQATGKFTKSTAQSGDLYGQAVDAGQQPYGDTLQSGVRDLSTALADGQGQQQGVLQAGTDQYGETLSPIADQTGDSITRLREDVARSRDGTLSSSQNRSLDKFRRDSISRLSASGLRGAGRAGVAATNEGEAALLAGFEDQNKAAGTTANTQLFNAGVSATKATADNQMAAVNKIADTIVANSRLTGQAALDAKSKIATALLNGTYNKANVNLSQSNLGSQATLTGDTDVARMGNTTDQAALKSYNDLMAKNTGIKLTEADMRGDYATNSANANAQSLNDYISARLGIQVNNANNVGKANAAQAGAIAGGVAKVGSSLFGNLGGGGVTTAGTSSGSSFTPAAGSTATEYGGDWW